MHQDGVAVCVGPLCSRAFPTSSATRWRQKAAQQLWESRWQRTGTCCCDLSRKPRFELLQTHAGRLRCPSWPFISPVHPAATRRSPPLHLLLLLLRSVSPRHVRAAFEETRVRRGQKRRAGRCPGTHRARGQWQPGMWSLGGHSITDPHNRVPG